MGREITYDPIAVRKGAWSLRFYRTFAAFPRPGALTGPEIYPIFYCEHQLGVYSRMCKRTQFVNANQAR